MFYTHYKKWNSMETFNGVTIVKHTKVLGFVLDQKLNNMEQIKRVKGRVE